MRRIAWLSREAAASGVRGLYSADPNRPCPSPPLDAAESEGAPRVDDRPRDRCPEPAQPDRGRSGRAVYKQAVELIESGAPDEDCANAVRQSKAHANYVVKHVAKPAVVFAWEASGSAGMRNPNRLQRCFRDIHIGAGHQVFDDRGYREAAKAALGLEPAPF